jgi:hypothetical protein
MLRDANACMAAKAPAEDEIVGAAADEFGGVSGAIEDYLLVRNAGTATRPA